ncbi:MAG: hypothetical protein PWP24_780 [Clostridiales bacterium]|nr:hypothetical protein [Clostridiales bacterium]
MKVRKQLSFSLVTLLLIGSLSSCQTAKMDLSYSEDVPTLCTAVTESSTLMEPMAKDLCVVPANRKNDTDSELTAGSCLIFDTTDQKVLYQSNVYERLFPASITKLMTAYVAFQYADLEDTVTFSYAASHITESGAKLCGFKEGDQVKLRTLLAALLIYSGNDAGVAIAEHISGSVDAFAALMNEEADKLGATGSHFVNPHGLHDENHYTTTYDIYLILNQLVKNQDFLDMISSTQVLVPYVDKDEQSHAVTFHTTNQYLLGEKAAPKNVTVLGGKTGTTSKAGSCLALYSKGDNDHYYISIVFQAANKVSLYNQMTELLAKVSKE